MKSPYNFYFKLYLLRNWQWLGDKYLFLFVYFFYSIPTFASYIVGGTIGLEQINNIPGRYNIDLTLIIDLNATTTNTQNRLQTNSFIFARIFRKSDNIKMADFTLPYSNQFDVAFTDYPTCSKLRDVKQRAYNYKLLTTLDPNIYDDPQGYYLVWERCCRNDDIDNIQSAPEASMVLYAEFPSLKQHPQYSSPVFSLTKNEYICLNKSFNFKINSTDADNDQLKFKLVTPINGNNKNQVGLADIIVVAGPYPLITWLAGLSATNSIPGEIPLKIDETTGVLEVKPNKTGLYLFAVECAEFRNGVQIGFSRLEFQFPVVDCSKNTPSIPIITNEGIAAKDLEVCNGKTVGLETAANSAWFFQWQKDGVNLPSATSNKLDTKEAGVYKVIKSLKNVCANDTVSSEVTLALCDSGLQIYVPTAFSPNQDGLNDELVVIGRSLDTFHLLVYNKWGEVVFESDDINKTWNGGWRNDINQPVPVGQYVLKIKAVFTNTEKVDRQTSVIVLR
ncbi:hypothetical protein EMA8858_00354 [Emticicia aquatica]|uniref:Gliding motility-associated C-terminal domain-containing protein n=1 Tax=Emticicia aquatica TaxID=1681835 RepID=A0ABN8ENR4_9BACT|nr:gliding motility-associated C-terminal domain-containing protein [Emticicia aquatica]CAH0994245.1 hypothetical protein EMA8858_00354 [Emticicia aquatica]